MAEYALRLDNGVDTKPRIRRGDGLSLTHDGPTGTRSGLRPDGGGTVSVVESTMGVEVSPFTCWVDGSASDAQGGYPFILDALKSFTLSDGDASQDRTDTVAVVVYDDTFDASGQTTASVTVVEGTPGAGAPALPGSAVALRDVVVPAGASAGTGGLSSSDLGADRRVWTAASGGIVPVASVSERDVMQVAPGQPVYRTDTGTIEVWNGTEWSRYQPVDDSGWVTLTLENGWSAGAGTPQIRRIGDLVHVRGTLDGSSASSATFTTLPTQFRPGQTVRLAGTQGFADGLRRLMVFATGEAQIPGSQGEAAAVSIGNSWMI